MKILKSAFASAAAAGLLVSQVAVAAPVADVRTGAAVGPSEGLGFPDGAAPVIAIISLLALVALIVVITDGDDDEEPFSP